MVHQLKPKHLFFFLLATVFTACYEVDFAGFFIRSESANLRFEESMEWNALNPYRQIAVPADDYLIMTMGDSHVGGTDNLIRFFEIALDQAADAVVMVGDLTTGREEDYLVFQAALPGQETIPWFPLVGNHDLYFGGWEHFYSMFGASVYLFTVQTPEAADLFISLDTGSGTLGSKQLDWLKKILEQKRDEYRHCLVFTHNNFFRILPTLSTNPPVEELHVLMDLFARHRVDMFVSGHDHRHSVVEFGNTVYLVTDALRDGLSNAGYLEIRVVGESVGFSSVQLQ